MLMASADGPRWRVFVSHTSELRDYPVGASYVAAVERAISAAGHVVVDMADFPSVDAAPAQVCIDRVQGCDVYVGILGTQYGSPVRDRPEVSYTELEFQAAADGGIDRLMFLLDTDADALGIPPKALIDREHGARQDAFRERVRASALTAQTFRNPDDLARLVERSLRDLADARRRRPAGGRRLAVGHEALRDSLSAGDARRFFTEDYERLADAYLDPGHIIKGLDLEHFTGREDVLAEIDSFLGANDRGYVEIEGALGVGKTALLAWLVTQRGYLHHFVQLMPNRGDVGIAMRNLGAQLIRAWDLHTWALGGVLPESAARPDFFANLLDAAAGRRDQLRPGEPIVLVLDGLDEAGRPQAGNVLALPRHLPRGVYVVVAHRDVYVPLAVDPPKRVLRLTAEENLPDMERYLHAAARRPGVATRLAEHGVGEDAFVTTVLAKTSGLWLYLWYVVVEIETGNRSPADLDKLPGGLWQYYEQFWRSWQESHPEQWAGVHQPLLSTLGAVREAVSAAFLAELAGIADVAAVEPVLDEAWAPFLDIDESADTFRYSISQASFRAFLEGDVDVDLLNNTEVRTVRRTAAAVTRAHGRIADRYLAAWGGLEHALPLLRDPQTAALDGGYGLRHLVEHLIGAGREDDLHRLLWTSWESTEAPADAPAGRVVNAWRQSLENADMLAVYLNDVASAARLVEARSRRLVAAGAPTLGVSLELRYALLSASVSSMAANVPPALLVALLQQGRLSDAGALAYARRGPDPLTRIEALLAVSASFRRPLVDQVLREALVATQAVDDEQLRTAALARLVPVLPEEWREEASEVAAGVVDAFWRRAAQDVVDRLLGQGADALESAPVADPGDESWHDPRLALPHAIWFARTLRDRQGEALARLAARLPEHPDGAQVSEALDAARLIPQDRWRAEALTAVASRLPEGPARVEVLDQALAGARAVGDSEQHAAALAALAARLARVGRPAEALTTARAVRDPSWRTAALADLLDLLPASWREEAVADAARGVADLHDVAERARVLAAHPALMVALAAGGDVLAQTRRTVRDDYWRAVLLAELLDVLDPAAADGARQEAFRAAGGLGVGQGRADVLARLASRLAGPEVDSALALVAGEAPAERAMAVDALAVRLVELGRSAEALATVETIEDPYGAAQARVTLVDALLHASLGEEALHLARTVPFPHWRAAALAAVSAAVSPQGGERGEAVLEEARASARDSTGAAGLAEALVLMATRLPPGRAHPVLDEAAATARAIGDPHDRARALARVAGVEAASARPEKALDLLVEIADEHWRADALRAVASSGVAGRDVDRVLRLVAALTDGQEQAGVLVALVPALAGAQLPVLYEAWRAATHLLGAGTRRDLLVALPDLLPAIERLGGPAALVEVRDVVESVRRWWP